MTRFGRIMGWGALLCSGLAMASAQVEVEALLPGMAVLRIDGQRHTLRQGQSVAGVTLQKASSQEAELLIEGRTQRLSLTNRISGNFAEASRPQAQVSRDPRGGYRTSVQVNGRAASALIDTGATMVAISGNEADRLGIVWRDGDPVPISTANSSSVAHRVLLSRLRLGSIERQQVQALVIPGAYPLQILVGMNFLSSLEMREQQGVLYLESTF